MLQCVINGPPNKRNVLSSLGASHASTVLLARDKSQSQGGRGRWPDSCAQQSQVLQGGRDLRWANGLRARKPCRLFPAHIFGSRPLGSRGRGRTLSRALLGRFSWPWPQSNFHAGTGCWPLLACPRGLCGLDTWTSRQYTPSRSQQQKSKSLAGWVLTSSVPAQECLARTLSSSHNARAIIRNKGPLNHGLTMLSEAATWGRM
jgi:hypothetical protein